MLFIRRNVPANIPPVSANASFCPRSAVSVPAFRLPKKEKPKWTDHVRQLDSRLFHLVAYSYRYLHVVAQ